MEDAVISEAYITRLNKSTLEFKPNQVRVNFEIEGKPHSKISKPDGIMLSANKIFFKYDEKRLKIMYSPKYDKVMFIKD